MNKFTKAVIFLFVLSGIILIGGIALCLIDFFKGLFCIVAAIAFAYVGYRLLLKQTQKINSPISVPQVANEPDESADALELPHELTLDGRAYSLRYSYTHVDVACPLSQEYASAGDWVTLELEPENPHDADAVRLVLDNGRILGYLYKGKLQNMAGDFLRKHSPVVGIVETDSASSILLGFYKED